MLEMAYIREHPEEVRAALRRRGAQVNLDELIALEARRRDVLTVLNEKRAERNRVSQEIGARKRAGQDASALLEEMGRTAAAIKARESELRGLEARLEALALLLPNLPAADVPEGTGAAQNVLVREGGTQRAFDFTPKPHWELGRALDILDFERASRMTGASFPLYKGAGAQLERALINYMLDLHVREHGYREVFPPFLVNRAALTGTGQLPKAEEDMYRCEVDDFFLIPTAEVPVTNLHRDEILGGDDLPLCYVAYSACFRREAGSYGRGTRGLMRVHQFNKVELVRFERPEDSPAAHDLMLQHAETVVRSLGLRYRIMLLCAGDMGFSAAKCYDIEAWAPGIGAWMEVSSVSNCTDFQARRCNIRWRGADGKIRFVHTLNGSGVALPRTMLAILETYQRADGSIEVPAVLRPYMGGLEVIGPGR